VYVIGRENIKKGMRKTRENDAEEKGERGKIEGQ
jgi:hypothetical protein